jgi:hypothetical protein
MKENPKEIKNKPFEYIIPKVEDLRLEVSRGGKEYAIIDTRFNIKEESGKKMKVCIFRTNNMNIINETKKRYNVDSNTNLTLEILYHSEAYDMRNGMVNRFLNSHIYLNSGTSDLPLFHNSNFKYGYLKGKDFKDGDVFYIDGRNIPYFNKIVADTIREELIPEYKANKMEILEVCDKFRTKYKNGEKLWNEMMGNKIQTNISLEAFVNKCNMDRFLDEDETSIEYMEYQKNNDPDFGIYESKMMNEDCMFFQVAGFEYIFVKNDFKDKLKKLENDEKNEAVKDVKITGIKR